MIQNRNTTCSICSLFLLIRSPCWSPRGLYTDIMARYKRMKGFNVLHPMGWDSFGLPAENYAIKTGTHPQETTENNIATFKRQLKMLGFSYDWDVEVATSSVDYYKWTQWIFVQLYNKGLAYESQMDVNWCPELKLFLLTRKSLTEKVKLVDILLLENQ